MVGKVILMPIYTRDIIRSNPEILFVFGDNMLRIGYGGQAKEARGELNAIGIVTKFTPSKYLSDEDFNVVKKPIVQAFVILARHLISGKDIVWPADGVGTGLANLPNVAPQVHAGIEKCRIHLFSMAKEVIRINS